MLNGFLIMHQCRFLETTSGAVYECLVLPWHAIHQSKALILEKVVVNSAVLPLLVIVYSDVLQTCLHLVIVCCANCHLATGDCVFPGGTNWLFWVSWLLFSSCKLHGWVWWLFHQSKALILEKVVVNSAVLPLLVIVYSDVLQTCLHWWLCVVQTAILQLVIVCSQVVQTGFFECRDCCSHPANCMVGCGDCVLIWVWWLRAPMCCKLHGWEWYLLSSCNPPIKRHWFWKSLACSVFVWLCTYCFLFFFAMSLCYIVCVICFLMFSHASLYLLLFFCFFASLLLCLI